MTKSLYEKLYDKHEELERSHAWKARKNGNDIVVSVMDDKKGGPTFLRMETTLSCKASQCMNYTVMEFLAHQKEWNHTFAEGRIVEQLDENNWITYAAYASVWPVKPRDFVYQVAIGKKEDGTLLEFAEVVEHADCPDRAGYVRADICFSSKSIQDLEEKSCRYIAIWQTDLRGWMNSRMILPALVNNFYKEGLLLKNHFKSYAELE